MKVHCPQCRGTFRVEGEETGTKFQCPFCKAPFAFQDRQTVVLAAAPGTPVDTEPETTETPALPESTPPGPEAVTPPTESDFTEKETVKHAAGSGPAHKAAASSSPAIDPTELTDLRVGDRLDGYQLEEVVGAGGMSVVFRANQLSLNRPVAIKVLRKDLGADPEFSKRFLKEAQALAELSHPNIIGVFDQGVHGDNHFLVMEFIDGVSLRDFLSERRLNPAEALKLVPQLCDALEYAHSQGIIHRDIKPENILLDRDGRPKIADFGLVRMVGKEVGEVSRLTKTQTVMGTLDYMAPEQREGVRDIDHRADIYSLGVVLYEMLTGELPIARFPLPSERVKVDVRLDEVVLKVLQKDRDRRYQRASLIATDLKHIESGPHALGGKGTAYSPAWQKALKMAGSPPFFLFTLLYLAVLLGSGFEEEPTSFFTGFAIPFYISVAILHGVLPRLPLPRDVFVFRHPFVAFGALTLFLTIMTGNSRGDAELFGLFCIGMSISCGLSLLFRRQKLLRNSGEPLFVSSSSAQRSGRPWPAGPHPVRQAAHSPEMRRVAEKQGPVAPPPAPHAKAPSPPPPPPEGAAKDPGPSSEAIRVRPAAGSPEAAQASPPPVRLSWLVILAFLVNCLFLVYAAAPAVALGIFGLSTVLSLPIEYHEISGFLRNDLWNQPPAVFEFPFLKIGAILAFVPLVIPALANLVGFLRIQSSAKRGGWLLTASFVLFAFQGMLLLGTIAPVVKGVRSYQSELTRTVQHQESIDDPEQALLETLQRAVETHDPITRFALLHSAALTSSAGSSPESARDPLNEIALRSKYPQERKAAVALLVRLFPEMTRGEAEEADWVLAFKRKIPQVTFDIREAYLDLLSRVPDPQLSDLFWDQLTGRGSWYSRRSAEKWWTESAPYEALEDFGERCVDENANQLMGWFKLLRASKNQRFRDSQEVREALLGPVAQRHASERVRSEAQRLIVRGPGEAY